MLNVCGERRVLMAAPFHLRNKARENSLDAIIPVLELFFLFLFPLPVFPGQWETVLRVFCREKRLGEQLAGGWNHQTYKSFKRNDIAAISFFFHRQLCAPPLRGRRRKKTTSCFLSHWEMNRFLPPFRPSVGQWHEFFVTNLWYSFVFLTFSIERLQCWAMVRFSLEPHIDKTKKRKKRISGVDDSTASYVFFFFDVFYCCLGSSGWNGRKKERKKEGVQSPKDERNQFKTKGIIIFNRIKRGPYVTHICDVT